MKIRLNNTNGILAMMGGAVWVGWSATLAFRSGAAAASITFLFPYILISWLLLIPGLTEFYTRQADYTSKTALFGYLTSLAGIAVGSVGLVWGMIDGQLAAATNMLIILGFAGLIAGSMLLSLATLHAQVLPDWPVILLMFGPFLLLYASTSSPRALLAEPFGLVWIILGYGLCSGLLIPRAPQPQENTK